MHICLVTAKIPPTPCGVADHMVQLANSLLSQNHDVTIVTSRHQNDFVADKRVKVLNIVDSWSLAHANDVVKKIRDLAPDAVCFQWVPHLYHPRGLALGPAAIGRILSHYIPLYLIVHEMWVPLDRPLHFFSQPIQRWALKVLIENAVGVSVSIEKWSHFLKEKYSRLASRIQHVPVGSNIPFADRRQPEGIHEDDVVIALFSANGSGRDNALIEETFRTLKEIRPKLRWVCIGNTREELTAKLSTLAADLSSVFTGYLSPDETSNWLQRANVLIGAFSDGLTTRRGSVMAAMAHGLPVIATRGNLSDSLWFDSPVRTVESRCEILVGEILRLVDDPSLRIQVGRMTQAYYENHFSWEVISKKIFGMAA